jgi:ATP-dependent Clp endopeptidase proteolytic subunit ClpP
MNHGARPLRSTRRMSNLAGSRPGWYSIENKSATAGPSQVSIYDEIGFYGVSAGDFLAELRTITSDIELHLNSPGGDVFDGIAIYNCLKQRSGKVQVIVDGLAASAASFIAQAASPGCLEMAPHSQMMIHDGFAMAIGNAADMRHTADQLDQVSDEIASIYAERTGKPADYWRGLMKTETWLTDAQAVAEGLADKIHGQESVSNDWDLSVFAHFIAPQYPANASSKCPGCGKYNAPDADNCTSCSKPMKADAKADGIVTAAADEPDDDGKVDCPTCKGKGTILEGHRKCPDCQGSGKVGADTEVAKSNRRRSWPVLDADVDSSPWDASKAWSAGADSDDPAAFYKGICAGRKAGDPTTQAAWALPFKYSPSSPPNAAGVRNALARLSQTQGLTNEPEAKSTLEKAMKLVNPDYEPSSDRIDTELLADLFRLALEGAN